MSGRLSFDSTKQGLDSLKKVGGELAAVTKDTQGHNGLKLLDRWEITEMACLKGTGRREGHG